MEDLDREVNTVKRKIQTLDNQLAEAQKGRDDTVRTINICLFYLWACLSAHRA